MIKLVNLNLEETLQIFALSRKPALFNLYKNKKFVGYIYLDSNGFLISEYECYKDYDALDNIILEQKLLEIEIIIEPILKEEFNDKLKINLYDYFFNKWFMTQSLIFRMGGKNKK